MMSTRLRYSLLSTLVALSSACASAGSTHDVAWGPVDGPMCTVRVESAYDVPVEAGATVGTREIELGELEPDGARQFGVPCSFQAVTVFRVTRSGEDSVNRLGSRARALAVDEVTVVTLRPTSRFSAGLR